MNGRIYNPSLGLFLSVDPINQLMSDSQGGDPYLYTRNNPLRYVDPSGLDFWSDAKDAIGGAATDVWHGVTHFGGEVVKWVGENYRVIIVVAVVIVVTYVTLGTGTPEAITLGDAILAGAAAGAAGSATATALYGGTPDQIIQSAFRGAAIGALSGAAFYGVGEYFDAEEELSTTSQIESVAAHGVVGGAKEAVEGGDFWKGFVSTAATKASSLYGPQFDDMAANTARAAVVGGTVAELDGGKFANGAITGAFSYSFNDLIHEHGGWTHAFGRHQRLVVTSEEGDRIEGFSFGTDAPYTWESSANYGNETPVRGGTGTGEVYEDYEEPGRNVIERFKTQPDEDMAIKAYMEQRLGDQGKYNIWSNSCIQFCNEQYNYIKSQVEKSRREFHSPVFSH